MFLNEKVGNFVISPEKLRHMSTLNDSEIPEEKRLEMIKEKLVNELVNTAQVSGFSLLSVERGNFHFESLAGKISNVSKEFFPLVLVEDYEFGVYHHIMQRIYRICIDSTPEGNFDPKHSQKYSKNYGDIDTYIECLKMYTFELFPYRESIIKVL
ncbi:hypothetical protein RF11_15116 [Thelohanellus kitauei]|uniref:Uncharacterized protein n=1 Tax=Thelohanellus kitauei TaxID=669202 RepID=A0A0C2J7Z2_THEKT|nr:hypothetical protein RF11_15116 [Thelohanellus kitauei]